MTDFDATKYSDAAHDPFAASPLSPAPPSVTPEADISGDIKKRLSGAKWALIVVGVLTIGVNAFLFVNANKEIAELIRVEGEMNVDAETLVNIVRVVYGGAIALGVGFLVLGMLVYRFPILCPLTGLLLYIGLNAIYGVLDPVTLARGAIIKIIIIVVLFKALQSGFEVRRQRALAYDRMFGVTPAQ